jgi:hypothetical protein
MVRLRFETDASSTLKAGHDIAKIFDEVGDSVQGSVREMSALERAAKRLVDSNLSPQERYNKQLELMAKAVKAGKLSMEDAEKTAGRLRQRLDETGNSSQKAFNIERVGQWATGVFGASAALAALAADFKKTAQDADEAGERIRNALPSSGERAQVATDADDYKGLGNEVRDVRRRGIQTDKKSAEDLVFQLRSTGVTGADKESLLTLAEKGLIAPENILPVAESARKVQRAFGLRDMEATMDIAKQAAEGTNANMSRTLTGSLEMAQAAKAQGLSGSDAMAALVVAEQQSKSIDVAGTQMKALFEAAQQKGIKGNTIDSLLDNITAQSKGKTVFDVLGRSEAVTGYQTLMDRRGDLHEQMRLISTADERNVASRASDLVGSDPDVSTAMAYRRSVGAEQVQQEDMYGQRVNLIGTVRRQIDMRQRERGGFVERFIGSPMRSISNTAEDFIPGGQDYFLKNLTNSEIGQLSPDVQKQVLEYQRESLEVQREHLEETKKANAAKAPSPSGRQE